VSQVSPSATAVLAAPGPERATPSGAGRFGRAAAAFAPALSILLLLGMLAVLLWLIERTERDEANQNLIRDALWVEQSLQFQFASQLDVFGTMARDMSTGQVSPAGFDARATRMMSAHPEILDMSWRDPSGNSRRMIPAYPPPDPALRSAIDVFGTMATRIGRTVISDPIRTASGRFIVVLFAPLVRPDTGEADSMAPGTTGLPADMLVVTYALDKVLIEHSPWWIAEKRAVVLYDAQGAEVARRAPLVPPDGASSKNLAVSAPLRGLTLTLTTFNDASSLAQNAIIAAMVVLGLTAVGGLIARERALRRREASESALRDETAFRRAMEDSLTIGMRARDLDGRVTYVNQAFCRMTGWASVDLIGQGPPQPYWLPEDMERTQRVHDTILQGIVPENGFEITYRRRDGTRFDALVYEAPLVDAQGRQQGWMGSFIDITDRRRMEATARDQAERLQQTARLVAIGEMASLLAHDLNQPLAAISAYAAGLSKNLVSGAPLADVQSTLAKLGDQAERAGSIVRRVRAFAKRTEPHRLPVDLERLINETKTALASEMIAASVVVTTVIETPLPQLSGDAVLLEQVLVNLLRNATDALGTKTDGLREINIDARTRDGSLELSVTDNGPGVAAQMVEHLFTAFASSKSHGMGLGLTICRSILEVHGGSVRYAPRTGGGSTFICRLPLRPA
jgi:two-component system, LuxR family, sensor histidine kinase DctS